MVDLSKLLLRDIDHLNKVDSDSKLDTLEYRNETTGNSAETKLMDVTGRRFFLDVNPRLRSHDSASSLQGTIFGEAGYFYKADAYYDRLTGLGFAKAKSDASIENWDHIVDENDTLGTDGISFSVDPELIKKYENDFDPIYVLGILDKNGKTGGEITNFSDWIYFLQQAYFSGVEPVARKIVEFVRELYSQIDIPIELNSTELRLALTLLSVDQMKREDFQQLENVAESFTTLLNLESVKLNDQDLITNKVMDDLILQGHIPETWRVFDAVEIKVNPTDPIEQPPDILQAQKQAQDIIDNKKNSLYSSTGSELLLRRGEEIKKLAQILKGDDRVEVDISEISSLAYFLWDNGLSETPLKWSELPYRFVGEFTDQGSVKNLGFANDPNYIDALFDSHLEEVALASKTWKPVSEPWETDKNLDRAKLLHSVLLEYIGRHPQKLFDKKLWQDLLRLFPDDKQQLVRSFDRLYSYVDDVRSTSEMWQKLTGMPVQEFWSLQGVFKLDDVEFILLEMQNNMTSEASQVIEGSWLASGIRFGNEQRINAELAEVNEYVLLQLGYYLGHTYVAVPEQKQRVLIALPFRIVEQQIHDVYPIGELTYYYVTDARQDFPAFNVELKKYGVPDNFSLQSHAVNQKPIARGDEQVIGPDGPIINIDFERDRAKSYFATLSSPKLPEHPFGWFLTNCDLHSENEFYEAFLTRAKEHETSHYVGAAQSKMGEGFAVLSDLAGSHPRLMLFEYGMGAFGRDAEGRICLKHTKDETNVVTRTSADDPYSASFLYFLEFTISQYQEELGVDEIVDLQQLFLSDPVAFDAVMTKLLAQLEGMSDAALRHLAKRAQQEYVRS